jgi:hypothetical protein
MTDGLRTADNTDGARACGRGEELVAYIYGEANPREAASFDSHLKACATCRAELTAFGAVRHEVAAWREQVLKDAPRVEFVPAHAPTTLAATRPARVRSARAALREFFALSPLWLRAGVVAAALAVCALAAFAFRAGVAERTVVERVEVPSPDTFTAQQVKEITEQRVREALEAARAETAGAERETVVAAGERVDAREGDAVTPVPVKEVRQPRRGQLAEGRRIPRRGSEYLPVAEEEELPRLSDLLSEAN